MGLPHLPPQDVTRDFHRCWRSFRISGGKTEQIDWDVFRVPQWQWLFNDLRKDGFQALHEEGTDGIKIGVFFESRCSTKECPLRWRTIKSVFPCLSAEYPCETMCPRSFGGTMPRQQSVHCLPQWKQQPQVDSLCLRNRLDGIPCDFHPIGVQEH